MTIIALFSVVPMKGFLEGDLNSKVPVCREIEYSDANSLNGTLAVTIASLEKDNPTKAITFVGIAPGAQSQ